MSKIIISRKGREFGPFTVEVTRAMFLAGRFLPNDQARPVGAKNWVPLIRIPGVAKASRKQTPGRTTQSQRMGLVILAVLIGVLVVRAGVDLLLRGHVDGRIFVTAQGGRNYKLGQVTVSLFPLNVLKEHLSRKSVQVNQEFEDLKRMIAEAIGKEKRMNRQEKEARDQWTRNPSEPRFKFAMEDAISANRIAKDAHTELMQKSTRYYDGACFFDQLPKAITSAQTDEDGQFSIKTPSKGDFAIAAKARSPTNPEKEHCWMIRVALNGNSERAIVLSNDNRISADSPDSLVQPLE